MLSKDTNVRLRVIYNKNCDEWQVTWEDFTNNHWVKNEDKTWHCCNAEDAKTSIINIMERYNA